MMTNSTKKNTNTNTNTNNKGENTMKTNNYANITRTETPRKNTVEIIRELKNDGTTLEFIAINDVKIGTMGYTSPEDRQKAIDFIQKIVDNSTKTGNALYREIMETCMTGAALTEKELDPADSEEDEIDGVPVIINYKEKKLFIGVNAELVEITDLEDLTCELPNEAIKALLIERGKNSIKNYLPTLEDDYEDEEENWD